MKKIVYVFIAFHISLFTFQVNSQNPTQEWVARYPRTGNDPYGPFLALDISGNSFVAGTHMVNDSNNILCVKYNTSGVQQWATLYKYPGEGFFAPTGLALDSFGNAYITSISGNNSLGPYNSLLIKFNGNNGSVLWARRYIGQYGDSKHMDIKIDQQNNIYVVGSSDSSHLVIKYNINGDSVWVRKYQVPSAFDLANACVIDDSLNVIITGSRKRCYSMPPPGICVDTLLVAKYSSGGILRWEHTYGYNILVNVGIKIVADQNGNVYIGGATAISGWGVYLTLKYDRNGNLQWTKIYYPPGSVMNDIYGIAMDRMNNVLFVTGYSVINSIGSATTIKYNALTGDSVWVRRGFGVPGSSSSRDVKVDSSGNAYIAGGMPGVSSSDVATLKYSPLGNPEWLMTYNGPFNGGDGAYALRLDNLKNVYVMGVSQSTSQVSDYVVIKYNQLVGIEPISNEIPSEYKLLQNYPNPFNSSTVINYEIPIYSDVAIKVYDVLGKEVMELINTKQEAGIYRLNTNIAGLSSGVYLYRLTANSKIVGVKKLIIIK